MECELIVPAAQTWTVARRASEAENMAGILSQPEGSQLSGYGASGGNQVLVVGMLGDETGDVRALRNDTVAVFPDGVEGPLD